ncbi:hypothetical protein PENSPDRAFT_759981 [Peniophora sp. CONT]|nr:hypothetical protein PENSPDRAFT_759981 [Peniophora sp. CONT]
MLGRRTNMDRRLVATPPHAQPVIHNQAQILPSPTYPCISAAPFASLLGCAVLVPRDFDRRLSIPCSREWHKVCCAGFDSPLTTTHTHTHIATITVTMFNGPVYNHNYNFWGSPPAYWSPLPPPVYHPPVIRAARPAPTYYSPAAGTQVINQRFEGPVENHFYESPAPFPTYAPPIATRRHPVYVPPRRPKTPKASPAYIPLALPAPSVYNLSPNTQVIMGTPYTGVNICNGCDGRQYCSVHNPWAQTVSIPAQEVDDEADLFTPGMYCVPSPWMTPRTPLRKLGRRH